MKIYNASNVQRGTNGGVVSVMNAHEKALRLRGVEYVNKESQADLVVVHALAVDNRRTDIYHSHGFYPTAFENWDPVFNDVNSRLINFAMTARAVVAVSELAAEVMRRDMHIQPHVIRNGVDFSEITPGGKSHGWVLWPKIAVNPTCDPAPVKWLADHSTHKVASMATIAGNVKAFGVMPRPAFLKMVRECSIYLGTTRENNPMAEMELMATGLPVVGYDWGFNREWLESGNGCELVEPNDLEGLSSAISKVQGNWKKYHQEAIEFANLNFHWDEPIEQIYKLYEGL